MYGYALVMALGGVLLILVVVGLARGNAGATGGSGVKDKAHKPVMGPAAPAADEPTADRSVTASPKEVEAARKHTPPS